MRVAKVVSTMLKEGNFTVYEVILEIEGIY